jgi:hypothetical protein
MPVKFSKRDNVFISEARRRLVTGNAQQAIMDVILADVAAFRRIVGHLSEVGLAYDVGSDLVVYGGGRYAPVRVAHPGVTASRNRHRASLTGSPQGAASAM